MIIKEHIKIYYRYNCDVDLFQRVGRSSEQKIFDYGSGVWSKIDLAIQDIKMINDNLMSLEYKNKTLERINLEFDSEALKLLFDKESKIKP